MLYDLKLTLQITETMFLVREDYALAETTLWLKHAFMTWPGQLQIMCTNPAWPQTGYSQYTTPPKPLISFCILFLEHKKKTLIFNFNISELSLDHSAHLRFAVGGLLIQGVPIKTRISENVQYTQITTFLKEPKCFDNKTCLILHKLISFELSNIL